MKKKLLSLTLAMCVVLSLFSGLTFSTSATVYNPTAAINYAANHWNDGVGACATFVSNCLKAGGCTASSSSVTSLRSALINGNWGTEYLLTRSGSYIYQSDNTGKVSPGDPIFFYCTACKGWEHVEIAGNYSNYVTGYGHNSAKNNTNVATFMDAKKHTGASYIKVYSFHINSHVHSYSTFIYYGKSHPHYNYYKCSCGDIKMSNETNIVDNCEICNPTAPGKPTLTVTSSDETKMVGFTWNQTDRTNNYDLRVVDANSVNVLTAWGIEELYYSYSLKPGTYTAWVCSNNDKTYTSSDRVNFTVSERSFEYKSSKTVTVGDKLFAVFNYHVSLDEANRVAQYIGGRLACIENEIEQNALFGIIKEYQNKFWIDGSDSETEGVWKHSDGTYFKYSNWRENEPDNFGGFGDVNFAVMYPSDGKWADSASSFFDNNYFIIELKLPKIAGYPDVNFDAWYGPSVAYAVEAGLMKGYANGKFGTSDGIQRQDFVVILARLSGDDIDSYAGKSSFKDVPTNAYYATALAWAKANGVSNGYNDGSFGVGDKVTREQIMTFLYNYAKLKGYDTTVTDAEKAQIRAQYSDFINVSSYAQEATYWALKNGVISGKQISGKRYISPGSPAQRCEVAAMFYNINEKGIFA